ncbi:MAG: hypothetical protein SOW51_08990 [Oscillospiraceae bacterium]|nr:hypothetical protein [Oscillospiraceae bacterium]
MDLWKIIEKKRDSAKYMVEEITYICKNIEKRSPGSTGEKKACEYMAEVLKKDCGCERADVESFKENPGSFYGWLFFTLTFVLAAIVLYFFAPVASIILIAAGLVLVLLQFGLYIKAIDRLFPEKNRTQCNRNQKMQRRNQKKNHLQRSPGCGMGMAR